MSKISDRLRAIAKAKADVDLSHGRKAPLYGERSEIESRAADLLDEAEKAMFFALEAMSVDGKTDCSRAIARVEQVLARLRGEA